MTAPQAEPTTRDRLTATALSALDQADFNARLGHVFEHSPWVAEAAWAARPFASLDALHGAMMGAVVAAGPDATLALLRAHPALAAPGPLTPDSVREQGEGLGALGLTEANAAYAARFGFPFIVAMRALPDPAAIPAIMAVRMAHDPAAEKAVALREVAAITRFRLHDLVATEDSLTVHVLDTARGVPAAGLGLTLSRDGAVLGRFTTNAEGRCPAPLLAGPALVPGIYEIAYDVAAWRGAGDPGFYDRITIRFRVDPDPGHLHVPLLLSPYGYSTYRGS